MIGAQRFKILRQPEHQVLPGQRDHPVHLDPIGRVGRPLVDHAVHTQYIGAAQQVETIAYNRASRGAIGQTGAVQVGEVKTVQIA